MYRTGKIVVPHSNILISVYCEGFFFCYIEGSSGGTYPIILLNLESLSLPNNQYVFIIQQIEYYILPQLFI